MAEKRDPRKGFYWRQGKEVRRPGYWLEWAPGKWAKNTGGFRKGKRTLERKMNPPSSAPKFWMTTKPSQRAILKLQRQVASLKRRLAEARRLGGLRWDGERWYRPQTCGRSVKPSSRRRGPMSIPKHYKAAPSRSMRR